MAHWLGSAAPIRTQIDAMPTLKRQEPPLKSPAGFIRPVIVVPVHKSVPTALEIVSLRQLGRIMAGRNIVVVSPQTIDTQTYRQWLPDAVDLKVEPHWMESVRAYNSMMISPLIYTHLQNYTHMLLHEPDAILLSDDLDAWCAEPYDYIGAPWLAEGIPNLTKKGANGGLSLCNLAAMRHVTSSWQRWHSWRHEMGDLLEGVRGDRFKWRRGLLAAYPGGLLRGAHRFYATGWDIFFSTVVPPLVPEFRMAPPEVCVWFAWELSSFVCIRYTQGQLPLGLHAWAKYDFDFLKPHMVAAGVDFTGMEEATD
jgi:hypothetical protein